MNLCFGLLLLILVNILLGSTDAIINSVFDFTRFKNGFIKGGLISACVALTYFVGWLNPDVASIHINGTDVDILTALNLIVMTAYYYYGRQVIDKIIILLKHSNKPSE